MHNVEIIPSDFEGSGLYVETNQTVGADDMTQWLMHMIDAPLLPTILIIISAIVTACLCVLFCIMVTTRYRKKDSGSYPLTIPKENKRLIIPNVQQSLSRRSVEIY